ncbi:related to ire1-protein kinase [Ceraceosorus bombacis]|uniref:Related to ire1-protein kinase n=1 Tax=Ceraceosorus bombacis TaxID=401625 RepID=A0A0P1BDG3_9BASI|nr:related to ire1-protein kinase [Ceraceosorus bombacis]
MTSAMRMETGHYTLTIHSRADPSARQTLRYSTFAPNAADREVAAVWGAASPEARAASEPSSADRPPPPPTAIFGVPEDGSVICVNATTSPDSGSDESSEELDRTLWSTAVGGSVARVFDLVYPEKGPSGSRDRSPPVLVPHPVIPLSRLVLLEGAYMRWEARRIP